MVQCTYHISLCIIVAVINRSKKRKGN